LIPNIQFLAKQLADHGPANGVAANLPIGSQALAQLHANGAFYVPIIAKGESSKNRWNVSRRFIFFLFGFKGLAAAFL
jgi:hypothetical protein